MGKNFFEAVREMTDAAGNVEVAIIPLSKLGGRDAMDYALRQDVPARKIIESQFLEQTLDI
jgi:hypothetical protein